MALASVALISAVCGLVILSAIGAARAASPRLRHLLLWLQAALLIATLGAGLAFSFAGAHGKGALGALTLVEVVFGFVLGAGLVFAGYALSGRRARFAADLAASLWLGRSGPHRLDGGPPPVAQTWSGDRHRRG